MGGLGNQMFQYAFGKHLAIKHKTELLLDIHFLLDRQPRPDFVYRNFDLDIFNLNFKTAPKEISNKYSFLRNRIKKSFYQLFPPKQLKLITENPSGFDEQYLTLPDNVYLHGYWQNIKYFQDIAPIIREEFLFKEKISSYSQKLLEEIKETNSVCLNVRRADFLTSSNHRTLENSYYRKAEDELLKKVKSPQIYVFSDEVEWCVKNIKLKSQVKFIDHTHKGDKFRDYLELMSSCKHFIIPNSSFAWWAAWLSANHKNIVIAPKIWLHNIGLKTKIISPSNWIFI